MENVNSGKEKKHKDWNSIRVSSETRKIIERLVKDANKKTAGRKIKLDEIVKLGVQLIEPSHIEHLKERSLTNEDRKERLRQIYIKKCKQITKDEFTGFMLTPAFQDFLNEHRLAIANA